jgi:hypothetical protein
MQSIKIEMDDVPKADDVKRPEDEDDRGDGDAVPKEVQHRPHFEKNLYTFSASAGRHLKQELTNSVKP